MITKHLGFSLIELAFVVVIASILITFIIFQLVTLQTDSYKSVLHQATGSVKAAAKLFALKAKANQKALAYTLTEFTHNGITGALMQPYARGVKSDGSFDLSYDEAPEIFQAAGLRSEEWSYRIYLDSTHAVIAAPKGLLREAQPTQAQVTNTQCYFIYHWQNTGTPLINMINIGC